jgi:hypothetical protein
MTHFTDAELIRWRDTGPGPDRDRVLAHVAACAPCAARYAAAIRVRPLAADAASTTPDEARRFAQEGARIGTPPARVLPLRRGALLIGAPLAAAALLVLAISLRGRSTPGGDATPVFRGTAVHALAPQGAVAAEPRFEWSSGVAASRYRIDVGDATGVVASTEAPASPAPWPGAWTARLKPAVPYWWTVTAVDAEGRPVATSERRTFTLSR